MGFVYTQLNDKTFRFQTIQFSVSTVSISKAVPFQTIQIIVYKNSSISYNSVYHEYESLKVKIVYFKQISLA